MNPTPPRQIERHPARWAKLDANVRTDYGDEDSLRALARSRAKHQITPMIARADRTLIDGYRTRRGLELEGLLDVEMDFIIVEESTPDSTIRTQLLSATHRADLSPYDKAVALRDIKAANPGMSNRQLAEEIADMDGGYITKHLSLFDCIAEVQQAAKEGKLSVGDWYAMSRSPDQLETLRLKDGGATRDQLVKATRKPKANAVRGEKLVVALPSGMTVKITGSGVSLEDAIEAAADSMKLMKGALAKGLNVKTAQAFWRDVAAN